MFCPSCGTEVASSLSYCNRCGAELNVRAHSLINSSDNLLISIVWAIVAVTVLGLGVIIGLLALMKETLHFNDGPIMGFALLSFLMLMAADGVFIWLLSRLRIGAKDAGDKIKLPRQTLRELDATPARRLPEPAMSVTETTTRALEPSHSERNAE